jgi:ubiquinone biosynthesis protein UbiJ
MLAKPLLASALETALSQYLAMDEDAELFLSPLVGKVIAMTIEPFGSTLYLCPIAKHIQVLEQYHGEPDTTITGSLWALGLMGLSSKPMRSVFSGEVKITGDTRTGKKFQTLFEQLDVDLEEKLSHFTGDIIAHKIGQFFRAGQSWGEDTLETLKLNITEFVQDETRDLPVGPELDIFYRKVDETRSDFDRLKIRVERLKESEHSA